MTTKQRVILVGAGTAGLIYWLPAISRSTSLKLIGVIDPDTHARECALEAAPNIWTAIDIATIPYDKSYRETVVFVVTPDHFPIIRDLGSRGFQKLIVEKPLVSRDNEVGALEEYMLRNKIRIYSVDHYYQKFMPLEFVLGRISNDDPRVNCIKLHGDHKIDEIPNSLGQIEGVTYTNIEAGELGIPDLDKRPWLEHDPEIGGMLRDLGSHAFAPLIRTGLLFTEATIMDVHLAKFNSKRDSFVPIRFELDIEMWVRAVLVWRGITVNVTFGKVPFPGKERSLAIRAKHGVFFAGLARGQSSVLMTNDGRTTRFSLVKTENDLVLEEAVAYFEGKLPDNFDGNISSSLGALRLRETLRTKYFDNRKS